MRRWFAPAIVVVVVMLLINSCAPARKTDTAAPPSSQTPTAGAASPSSNELIAAAEKSGEISSETALEYQVFAQFTDPRLPAKFQGSPDTRPDSHIVAILQSRYNSLSPEAQKAMRPFMIPPIYKGSWADPATKQTSIPNSKSPHGLIVAQAQASTPGREGARSTPFKNPLPCNDIDTERWDYKTAMHSPVRFWWQKDRPGDEQVVNRLITAMDDDIWPKLTSLMGAPLSDEGLACNGGSGDLDVYVSPNISRSEAPQLTPPGCKETPAYINLNPGETNDTLAHEFMHTIQWSYATAVDCMYPGDYAWLAEATAEWSQDYVYPGTNQEHEVVKDFFTDGSAGQTAPLELYNYNSNHQYGTYLFFFYLTHKFNDPSLVATAWKNATAMKSLDAVDKAIPGGYDEVFAEFAAKNVDEPPEDNYQLWDNLNMKPSGAGMTTGAVSTGTYIDAKEIGHLAISYNWYTFEEDARLVTFFNGLTYKMDVTPMEEQMGVVKIDDGTKKYKFEKDDSEENKKVKIQALYRVAGETEWHLEDWTDQPYVSFCRDALKERLTDLIVITSNSSQDQAAVTHGGYYSTLHTQNIGCYQYGGDASMDFTGQGEAGDFTDTQTIPNVVFERTDEHPNIPYPILHFKVKEGTLNRSYGIQSYESGCSGSGTSNPMLTSSPYAFGNDLYILYGAESGKSKSRYSGEANTGVPVVVNFTGCNGAPPGSVPPQNWFSPDILSEILEKVYTVASDGSIKGADNLLKDVQNAIMKFTWNLVALQESPGTNSTAFEATVPPNPGNGSSGSAGSSGSTESSGKDSLPGVPDYPNAEISKIVTGGMLIVSTKDTPDQVVQWYTDELAKQGWSLENKSGGTGEDPVNMIFKKGNSILQIIINASEGTTSVMIHPMNL
ncbi:MAG: hypothetical protein ABFD24_04275 [Anaerolineaceae bacterium]